jgi:hypothetical protein
VKGRSSIPGGRKAFFFIHVSEADRFSLNDAVSTKMAILRRDGKWKCLGYGKKQSLCRLFYDILISNIRSVEW